MRGFVVFKSQIFSNAKLTTFSPSLFPVPLFPYYLSPSLFSVFFSRRPFLLFLGGKVPDGGGFKDPSELCVAVNNRQKSRQAIRSALDRAVGWQQWMVDRCVCVRYVCVWLCTCVLCVCACVSVHVKKRWQSKLYLYYRTSPSLLTFPFRLPSFTLCYFLHPLLHPTYLHSLPSPFFQLPPPSTSSTPSCWLPSVSSNCLPTLLYRFIRCILLLPFIFFFSTSLSTLLFLPSLPLCSILLLPLPILYPFTRPLIPPPSLPLLSPLLSLL